jgi:5-methylcytosine-specific restriction endonuclease McrA
MDRPEYHSKRWRTLRAQVIRRDGPHCSITPCHSDMSEPGMIHVDHITEMEDGEPFDWDPTHLQVVCKPHHFAKSFTRVAGRGGPVSPNA